MADGTSKRDFRDRKRVSSEDYEVQYFAKENGLTPAQVRDLISLDRETMTKAANALRRR